MTYGPSNEMTGIQFATTSGAWYTETRTYNNLLQLTNINAGGSGMPGMNLTYIYNAGHNNGQVAGVNDALSGEQIAYTYDQLNRLIQAETTQNHTQYPNAPWWGQAYTFDGFGNLLAKTPAGPGNSTAMSLTVDPNTNHFTASGYVYDSNGNITSLPQSQGNLSLSYDVENRVQMGSGVWMFDMENQPLTGPGGQPVWDLDGRRLRHMTISYGFNGGNWQYAQPGYAIGDRNIYFGGRLIQSNSKTVLVDRTGSVRANESGETFEYFPYGEEFNLTSQDREKFATYTRSSANGLDYAVNRWYDSVHGNFITPDWLGASIDPSQPATFNRYSYVKGDPVNVIDPTGSDPYCGPGLAWDGEGCTFEGPGLGSPQPDPIYFAGYPTYPCNGNGSMIDTFETTVVVDCQGPASTSIIPVQGPGAPPYQPPQPNCGVQVGYVSGVFGTKYSHSFIDADYLGLNKYIEVSPNFRTVVPTMTVNFTATGVYNDSARGVDFWDDTAANSCIDAAQIYTLAADFPPAYYLGLTSNSNSFVSTILSGAGIQSPALTSGPPNAIGWGQPVVFVPILTSPLPPPRRRRPL